MTALDCFALASLAGLGIQWLARLKPPQAPPWLGPVASRIALLSLAALVVCIALLERGGAAVDYLLPRIDRYLGFWVAVCAVSLLAAVSLALRSVFMRESRWGVEGFVALALAEGLLFAVPFNPQVDLQDSPPLAWLREHTGDRPIAAVGRPYAVLQPPTPSRTRCASCSRVRRSRGWLRLESRIRFRQPATRSPAR